MEILKRLTLPHPPLECSCSPPHRSLRSPHSRWPVAEFIHFNYNLWCESCDRVLSSQVIKTTNHCRHLPEFGLCVPRLSFDPQTLCQSRSHHRPQACSSGHQTGTKLWEIDREWWQVFIKMSIDSYRVRALFLLFFFTSSISLAWPCWSMGLMAFCSKPTEPGYSILLPNVWTIRKLQWKKVDIM